MKKTGFRSMAIAVTFLVAVAFIAGNVLALGGKKADITGRVEQGKIVADNGKEYILADNSNAKELMSGHMCHQVQVTGTVTSQDGRDMITVSSFKHLAEGKC